LKQALRKPERLASTVLAHIEIHLNSLYADGIKADNDFGDKRSSEARRLKTSRDEQLPE
jgi:hypothetical protein